MQTSQKTTNEAIAFCSPPGQAHAWLPGIVLLLFVVFVFLIVFFIRITIRTV
jgi:hypothetical protein